MLSCPGLPGASWSQFGRMGLEQQLKVLALLPNAELFEDPEVGSDDRFGYTDNVSVTRPVVPGRCPLVA